MIYQMWPSVTYGGSPPLSSIHPLRLFGLLHPSLEGPITNILGSFMPLPSPLPLPVQFHTRNSLEAPPGPTFPCMAKASAFSAQFKHHQLSPSPGPTRTFCFPLGFPQNCMSCLS